MRIAVTGGAGFIGSNLVDALVERGEQVIVLDNLSSGKRANLAGALENGTKLVEVDIGDAEAVARAFADHWPERVFHLAAQIDVRVSVADPGFDLGVNVGGTINLLGASVDAGVSRFVFTSTGGAIYGEGDGKDLPLGEDADCRPDAPYGQSKLTAESYLGLYERMHGLSTVAMRLGNVYGPRQDPHGEAGVVAIFCGAMLEGRTPKVFGDGRQTRDYIYVGDVVNALLAAGDGDSTGALNIGTGLETSVLELGEAVGAAFGRSFEPETAPARTGEVQRISISSALAAAELGWSAETPIADGIEQTAAWTREASG